MFFYRKHLTEFVVWVAFCIFILGFAMSFPWSAVLGGMVIGLLVTDIAHFIFKRMRGLPTTTRSDDPRRCRELLPVNRGEGKRSYRRCLLLEGHSGSHLDKMGEWTK